MKKWILFSLMLVICGCAQPQQPQQTVYKGSVKITRSNSEVSQIEVVLPGQTVSLSNREDANQLIAHLEALTAEIKTGRDQFKVQEPAAPTPTPKK